MPRQPTADEDPRFLTEQVITYIGNKRTLLPFIASAIDEVCRRLRRERLRMADLFSGSGIVARLMKQRASYLLACDLEPYSAVLNQCFLTNASALAGVDLASHLRSLEERVAADAQPGLFSELYAPADDTAISSGERAFYTRANALYLDAARRAIGELEPALRPYFLGPLLASASVHANTAGVFKGFYKNRHGIGQFGGEGRHALSRICGPIRLELPVLSRFDCDVEIRRGDVNELAPGFPEVDLAYLDPPYNQHPYGSNYFMLNLLVDYERPAATSRVSGVPTNWRRSAYNRRARAEETLFALIDSIPARFLLLSYNSEGFIARERLEEKLSQIGRTDVLEVPYSTFRGSRNLRNRPLKVTEYMFLVDRNSSS